MVDEQTETLADSRVDLAGFRPDGQLQRVPASTAACSGFTRRHGCQPFHSLSHQGDCIIGSLFEVSENLPQQFVLGLRGIVGSPAVIVRRECDEGVADLRLAREPGLGQAGHAD